MAPLAGFVAIAILEGMFARGAFSLVFFSFIGFGRFVGLGNRVQFFSVYLSQSSMGICCEPQRR